MAGVPRGGLSFSLRILRPSGAYLSETMSGPVLEALERARSERQRLAALAWRRRRGRPGVPSTRRGEPLSRHSDEDVLAVNEALQRLERLDPRAGSLVELRFFGGLGLKATAAILGCSEEQAEAEWVAARAWLRRDLGEPDGSGTEDPAARRHGR